MRMTDSMAVANVNADIIIVGGGGAAALAALAAKRAGMEIHVDIFEPRDFHTPGPTGCNMCWVMQYIS